MFWSHQNNNCQKQIHFMKSSETVGTVLRPVSKYWRHLFVFHQQLYNFILEAHDNAKWGRVFSS
jgi:hypothetical protein